MVRFQHSIGKRLVALTALLAVMVSGFVPNGYMLDIDDDTHSLIIRICSADGDAKYVAWDPRDGSQTPAPGADGPPIDGDHDQNDDQMLGTCGFAAHPVFTVVENDRTVWASPDNASERIALPRGPPLTPLNRAPLPARGPPVFG